MSSVVKIPISVNILPYREELQKFCRTISKTIRQETQGDALLPYHDQFVAPLTLGAQSDAELALRFLQHVLVDLAGHGWSVKVRKDLLYLSRPLDDNLSHIDYKALVRSRKLRDRNAQLLTPSVSKFIDSMERRQLNQYGWHSIFSVMRDGRQLAAELRSVQDNCTGESLPDALKERIQPYLQFVERNVRCKHTGLLLGDIWRYFRHTWSNVYKTLPGRSISILVRDAAVPNHPVIGIAALGSAVAQQSGRDLWIGWHKDTIISQLQRTGGKRDVKWLTDALEQQIGDIYKGDFIKEKILRRADLNKPKEEAIGRLDALAIMEKERHNRFPQAAKTSGARKKQDWSALATTHLYRSKRAGLLADLLTCKLIFQKYAVADLTGKELRHALESKELSRAVTNVVRRIKADHAGIDMMDIIVCGAVPPYNSLLGGKLICTLLASPEVTRYVVNRYGEQESIIASSMKGRAVVRRPQLVLLGTTSLYRGNSSQYNRIRVPASVAGGSDGDDIRYIKLGDSEGFGLFQFSSATFEVMDTFLSRSLGGKRVNSIFGEGVNPLMRKIREALTRVGLPADSLLQHTNYRFVYGIPLATNFREILLGKQSRAKYIIPQTHAMERTEQLAGFWRKRWLAGRIAQENVLAEVASNTLEYPIRHKARVPLYKVRAALEDNLELDLE